MKFRTGDRVFVHWWTQAPDGIVPATVLAVEDPTAVGTEGPLYSLRIDLDVPVRPEWKHVGERNVFPSRAAAIDGIQPFLQWVAKLVPRRDAD